MKSIQLFSFLFLVCLMQACNSTSSTTDDKQEKLASESEVEALYKAIEVTNVIKLKKLTYYLDRPLVFNNKEDFTLDGAGCTFIMRDKGEDVIAVRNSRNVTLKNFKATHIEPSGPMGCTGSVIQVADSEEVRVEGCELNGSGIIGVVAYNTRALKVIDNYIYNNSAYGVLFMKDCSVEIKDNRFEDNGGDSGKAHVAKALDAMLSKTEPIGKGTNNEQLKMSNNTFE